MLHSGAQYVLVLSVKFASCQPPGACNFEVASRFVENVYTPVTEHNINLLCLFSYFIVRAGIDLIKSNNDQ